MALQSIEDWDGVLTPLKADKEKAFKATKPLDRNAASEAALEGDHWHDNMLRLVAGLLKDLLTKKYKYLLQVTDTPIILKKKHILKFKK